MKWSELMKEAHATACEKGWHDGEEPTPNRAGALIALMHDEVSEAWELEPEPGQEADPIDWDADKPVGLVFELADVLIRLADAWAFFDWPVWDFEMVSSTPCFGVPSSSGHAAYLLTELNRHVLRLLRRGRSPNPKAPALLFDDCVGWWNAYRPGAGEGQFMADGARADLVRAIEVKMAYNKTRSRRHGGKSL